MSRKCGAHRKLCCHRVADLSNHYLVGVLPKYGSKGGTEGPSGLFIDLYLVDTGDRIFHWIFDCYYIDLRKIDSFKNGIETCRLSASGGASHENYSVWFSYHLGKYLLVIIFKSKLLKSYHCIFLVKKPENHFFTINSGKRGNSKIYPPVKYLYENTAIKRFPALGNIHVSHDLDTGTYSRMEIRGKIQRIVTQPVDPVTNAGQPLKGFYMYIRSAFPGSLFKDAVHELDNRSIVGSGITFCLGEVKFYRAFLITDHLYHCILK